MKRLIFLLLSLTLLLAAGCQQEAQPEPEADIGNISNLQIGVTVTGMAVSWDAASGADHYYVYRAVEDVEGYTYWGATEDLLIIDESIDDGRAYRYRVYPALKGENRYHRSDLYLESGMQRIVRPPQITGFTYTAAGTEMEWTRNRSIEYYTITRIDAAGQAEIVGITPFSIFVDSQGQAGQNVTYEVRTVAAASYQVYKDGRLISPEFYVFIPRVVGGTRDDTVFDPDDLMERVSEKDIYQTESGLIYIEGGIRYERVDLDIYQSEPSVIK